MNANSHQEDIFASPEAAHDAPDEGADGTGFIQHGEGTTCEQEHHDDDNHRQPTFAAQHLDRSNEPAPKGVIRAFGVMERGGVDGHAPVHFDAGISSCRKNQGQRPGD